jgi:hypothetical protein
VPSTRPALSGRPASCQHSLDGTGPGTRLCKCLCRPSWAELSRPNRSNA